MPERKIVVVGDEGAVFGLSLLGLSGHAVTNVEEAREAIQKEMADPHVALILLTENWSAAQPESREQADALVVLIPSERSGMPALAIGTQIEQALGIRWES